MKTCFVLALVISLAAVPAAAQPKRPGPIPIGPVGPPPEGPGPIGLGPVGAPPQGPGPIGVGPLGPWPDELSPPMKLAKPPIDLDSELAPLMKLATAPLMDLKLMEAAPLAETKFLFDGMAFEFAQDRARDRETELREREREREAQLYSNGQSEVNDYQWYRALTYFNRLIELRVAKLENALYCKA